MPPVAVAATPLAVLATAAVLLCALTAGGWSGGHPAPGRRSPPWTPRAAAGAALGLAFAAAAWQLAAIGPGGSIAVQLWSLAPHLPLTIRADSTSSTLTMLGAGCAGLAGLGTVRGDRWTPSLTVVAAATAALAASAGDLVSLWVGLVLAGLASVGVVWRAHRATPARVWVGTSLTFAADLGFLAAVLMVWRQVGTTDYAVIPTGRVGPQLLALLLAAGVVRLTGAWTMSAGRSRGLGRARADPGAGGEFSLTTVPVGLSAIVRISQLSGAAWPPRPIAGGLVAVAVVVALVGTVTAVWPRPTLASGVRGGCLALAGLALAGFAIGGPDGLVLGVSAALALAVSAILVPALAAGAHAGRDGASGVPSAILALAGSMLPPTLGFGIGVLLVALASPGAGALGLGVALAWIAGLPAAVATAAAVRSAVSPPPAPARGPGPPRPGALLAATVLLAAAFVPGAVLRSVAPAVIGAGAGGSRLAASSRWLSDGVAGVTWAGGELMIVAWLGLALWWALGVLIPGRPPPPHPDVPGRRRRAAEAAPVVVSAARARSRVAHLTLAGAAALSTGTALAVAAVRDHPRWLWLGTVAVLAWLLVVR